MSKMKDPVACSRIVDVKELKNKSTLETNLINLFKCGEHEYCCFETFSHESEFIKHLTTYHKNLEDYCCIYCDTQCLNGLELDDLTKIYENIDESTGWTLPAVADRTKQAKKRNQVDHTELYPSLIPPTEVKPILMGTIRFSLGELISHIKTCHDLEYVCSLCPYRSCSSYSTSRHISYEHMIQAQLSIAEGKGFPVTYRVRESHKDLKSMIRRQVQLDKSSCKFQQTRDVLSKMSTIKMNETVYPCPWCPFVGRLKHQTETHVFDRHREKPFCLYSFRLDTDQIEMLTSEPDLSLKVSNNESKENCKQNSLNNKPEIVPNQESNRINPQTMKLPVKRETDVSGDESKTASTLTGSKRKNEAPTLPKKEKPAESNLESKNTEVPTKKRKMLARKSMPPSRPVPVVTQEIDPKTNKTVFVSDAKQPAVDSPSIKSNISPTSASNNLPKSPSSAPSTPSVDANSRNDTQQGTSSSSDTPEVAISHKEKKERLREHLNKEYKGQKIVACLYCLEPGKYFIASIPAVNAHCKLIHKTLPSFAFPTDTKY